jgi:hypothetical protein
MAKRSLMVLALIVGGCSSNSTSKVSPGSDAATGSGGQGTGGAASTGGASGLGGTPSSGGALGGGGASGMGGTSGNGGGAGTGGATVAGGVSSTGGATGGTQGDAAADVRSDVSVGTGGGPGTGGTGSGGAGSGGAGGTLSDAGRDNGGDAKVDLQPDASGDGYSKPVAVPDGGTCPYSGHVSYTFAKSGDSTVDNLIIAAMDKAIAYYNCYTNITKVDNVVYDPSVPTADGNSNGTIHFGSDTSYMILRVAMHEISHTLGVGQAANWLSFVARPDGGSSGPWTGANGIAQRQALLPDDWQTTQKVLTADKDHFWPYGLNLASDYKSEADLLGHCAMVMAIRKDLGLQP